MSDHPYTRQRPEAFWRRAISELSYPDVDPVVAGGFKLHSTDRVATAGSCFAQHISRHLKLMGFNYYVTETAHPIVQHFTSEDDGYGTYTARYGNVYTARQLLQLFHRAYNHFQPRDEVWLRPDGKFVDPFRPQISKTGYITERELRLDREKHLSCVREAFENLDLFVFTLGLTEAWYSKQDGAVLPICPGVAGGTFDESAYGFSNFRVREIVADLSQFLTELRRVNAGARALLTVSPVPLVATAEKTHVLVSTIYSKSALRAACEEIVNEHQNVFYFPSYEIITGAFNRGRYFGPDCRSVTEEGVAHVMRLFQKHLTASQGQSELPRATVTQEDVEAERVVRVLCDEEALDSNTNCANL